MLTVLEGRGCYLEGMSAGADDFVHKPVGPDELAARLRVGERILGLQTEVRQLEELLPICSYCKKIRDDDNSWHELDRYVARKTDTSFSHGICGECLEIHVEPQLRRLQDASSSRIG
jgi:CheY-like chemotaxis protein